jgi:hypothetical protein
LSQSTIDSSIEQLIQYSKSLEQQQERLEAKLERLREQEIAGAGNQEHIRQELQKITMKLENLSIQNASGVAALASGRLQCPRLFFLWPMNGPRRLGVRRLIYKEYRLFFMCAYDNSLVETSVNIKYASAWLRKVAPVLKYALFTMQLLVIVYGIPIPKLPGFIPGVDSGEKFKEVVEHTETLFEDIDPQSLSSLQDMLDKCLECINQEELQELIQKHEGEISPEAYGALAAVAYKPKNRGWMSEMEIAHRGSEYAWVKKENVKAFEQGLVVKQQPSIQHKN